MIPIGRRLFLVRNDAMHGTGKRPTVARVHPRDYEELKNWNTLQNQSHTTGLPQQALDVNNLWGMKVVADEKVRGVPVLEFEQ